jgi:hypothetical protein
LRLHWCSGLLGLLRRDAETIADVRCLLVGFNVSGPDSKLRAAGQVLSMYYFGRLDAHIPNLDIEALIIQEAGVMTPMDFACEAVRCGNSFADKGREIKNMRKDIIERTKTPDKASE